MGTGGSVVNPPGVELTGKPSMSGADIKIDPDIDSYKAKEVHRPAGGTTYGGHSVFTM